MLTRKLMTAAVMASMVAAPISAQASTSVPARTATHVYGEAEGGDTTLWIVLGAAALILLIVLIASGDDEPVSP